VDDRLGIGLSQRPSRRHSDHARQFCPSAELEVALLRAWLGRAPDEMLYARLTLVRALTRLNYAGVLLSAWAAGSWKTSDSDLTDPPVAGFWQAIGQGQLSPGTIEIQTRAPKKVSRLVFIWRSATRVCGPRAIS
jgi:hypothetical protein